MFLLTLISNFINGMCVPLKIWFDKKVFQKTYFSFRYDIQIQGFIIVIFCSKAQLNFKNSKSIFFQQQSIITLLSSNNNTFIDEFVQKIPNLFYCTAGFLHDRKSITKICKMNCSREPLPFLPTFFNVPFICCHNL